MDILLNPTPGFLTLATANWVIGLLTVGFLACSVLLILTVLIQRPQGGGLSGAFGGGGGAGGETAFGARTGDALTIATISFFVLWLAVATGLVLVMTPKTAPPPGTQAVSNEGPEVPDESSGENAVEEVAGTETPADEGTGNEIPAGEGDAAPTDDAPTNDTARDSTGETTEPPAGEIEGGDETTGNADTTSNETTDSAEGAAGGTADDDSDNG